MKNKFPPIYFLNYTRIPYYQRTTEIKTFDRYREAVAFAVDNGLYGYIIKQDESGNSFKKFLNGFDPSATEEREMESILNINKDHEYKTNR